MFWLLLGMSLQNCRHAKDRWGRVYDDISVRPRLSPGVEKHFWTMARIGIVTKTLRNAARAGLCSAKGRILDVGCGPGIVVGALREKGYDIWGVDLGNPSVVTFCSCASSWQWEFLRHWSWEESPPSSS
jgi:2-polyprenyl-3-methyl-5-hydroxy-6-metoxy-1,4-benzoquinol methylase